MNDETKAASEALDSRQGDTHEENALLKNQGNQSDLPVEKSDHRYECLSCGYVYDPKDGVKKFGISKGTAFVDLDETSFRCPVCRARIQSFKDIGPRSRPSGFEENLNYGFGVNNLTPGQKNILIFGGLSLIVAFFLSLYSLR